MYLKAWVHLKSPSNLLDLVINKIKLIAKNLRLRTEQKVSVRWPTSNYLKVIKGLKM